MSKKIKHFICKSCGEVWSVEEGIALSVCGLCNSTKMAECNDDKKVEDFKSPYPRGKRKMLRETIKYNDFKVWCSKCEEILLHISPPLDYDEKLPDELVTKANKHRCKNILT